MEDIFNLSSQIQSHFEKEKERIIIDRLNQIDRQDVVEYIKSKKRIKFPPMVVEKYNNGLHEVWYVNNNTDEGLKLVEFRLEFPTQFINQEFTLPKLRYI